MGFKSRGGGQGYFCCWSIARSYRMGGVLISGGGSEGGAQMTPVRVPAFPTKKSGKSGVPTFPTKKVGEVGSRTGGPLATKFLSPQPVLYGTGPMWPDRSAMPARPPNGPRPAPQPCTGKGIPSRKPPTQRRETRTDSRVVEDRKPPATVQAGWPGKPRPAPPPDSSPPPAPLVGSRLQVCNIRTRPRCLTPRGAIKETTAT